MAGMEVIDSFQVEGVLVQLYGCYADSTPVGEYDYYDIYTLNNSTNMLELLDLGYPLVEIPKYEAIYSFIVEKYHPRAVKVINN